MIDTYSRDPRQTWDDVQQLVGRARAKGMKPLEWHLGYFMARDIAAGMFPSFGERRKLIGGWIPLRTINDAAVSVVMLEDYIELIAGRDGPGGMLLERFTIDRRRGAV